MDAGYLFSCGRGRFDLFHLEAAQTRLKYFQARRALWMIRIYMSGGGNKRVNGCHAGIISPTNRLEGFSISIIL
jgi:hypothetical protein